MRVIGRTGTQYQLESSVLAEGGEGKIFHVHGQVDKKVAKIYAEPTKDREEKLLHMVKHPPIKYVAWPLDVIYNEHRQFCGFIMDKLSFNVGLDEIYEYQQSPSLGSVSNVLKIGIAKNISTVINNVHKKGYVFGDFNPRNIGVDKDTGFVSFLDTDSYHINNDYRCIVCAPGYVAPELLYAVRKHIAANPDDKTMIYAKMSGTTFTRETDNFALAVHIFKLLMNGFSPYGGIPNAPTRSRPAPGPGDAEVLFDTYCFKDGYKPRQKAAIPRLESFPQEIADLFTRAFIHGRNNPKQRPSAIEWLEALKQYEKELVSCRNYTKLHQYHRKNGVCPYCEADPEERKKRQEQQKQEEERKLQVQYDQLIQEKNRVFMDGNYQELAELADKFRAMNYKDSSKFASECDKQHRVLKEAEQRRKETERTRFFDAVSNGNISSIQSFIKSGMDVNEKNKDGNTLLHESVRNRDEIGVPEMLVSMGADVNLKGKYVIPHFIGRR